MNNILKAIKNPFRAISVIKDMLLIRISKKEFVAVQGNRSASDTGPYIRSVNEALKNPKAFQNFKKDPRYRAVLEHVTKQQGEKYLEIIQQESPDLIKRIEEFKINDMVGGAVTHKFKNVGEISPSTLRYIKVASDLKNIFGEDIGDKVCEIGIGYGGQLVIADKILKFRRYDLFDLPPVLTLASMYIEAHLLNSAYKLQTINQHTGEEHYDLVISNYAFSELPSKLQKLYIEKIISKSKKGYITMNSGKKESAYTEDKLTIEQLKDLLPNFEIYQENPPTHPANYIIVWGKL